MKEIMRLSAHFDAVMDEASGYHQLQDAGSYLIMSCPYYH